MSVYTYHNYVGYGLDPKLAPKMMSTSWEFFNQGPKRAKAFIDGWNQYGKPAGMEIWVGEIAAAWHSGEPGVTNRFISSFWYADALGLLASLNHTGFCRQTLAGGNYGLLNRTTFQPNPDFYVAQLFHDLMGERVLEFESGGALDKGLRTYAHCHSGLGGKATMLLINVSPSTTFSLTMDSVAGPTAEVFALSAGDGSKAKWKGLDSRIVRLNGDLMDARVAGPLPAGKLVNVPTSGQLAIEVQPLSIMFVVRGGVKGCQS